MSASKRFVWPSCVHRFNGKYVGAYRIRPSWRGCCIFDDNDVFAVIISFPLTWGRMRYAPTLVRWLLRLNRINDYPCSIKNDAYNNVTKPSNESRRCWLGLHKTLKRFATMLTRVTQNPQTIRDDAVSGYTKGSNHSVHPQIGLHKRAVAVATTKLRSHSLANAVATVKMLHRSLYRC